MRVVPGYRWTVIATCVLALTLSACSEEADSAPSGATDGSANIDGADGATAADGSSSADVADVQAGSDIENADDTKPAKDTYVPSTETFAIAPDMTWAEEPLYVPNAVHMTWANDASSTMVVQWKTTGTDIEAHLPKVLVNTREDYEANGEQMVWSEAAVTTGFSKTWQVMLAGVPIDSEVYAQYEVELTGLEPHTDYVYMAGFWSGFDTESGRFEGATISSIGTFRTGRVKGDRGPIRFVMAGDSRGGTDEIKENIDRLAKIDADMWFFNGDMTNGGTQPEWDTWFDAMGPVINNHVLMPVQGNHEIFPSPYYEQYALPVAGPELPDEMKEHAWSLDYGNIHFIGLDSNAPSLMDEQLEWLDSDLQQATSDPDIDWTIALMHHPAYSASTVHGSTGRVLDKFVPLFDKYGVDFVFTGHDHAYERTVPIRNNEQVEEGQGTVYVVAGGFYSPGYNNGSDWWTVVSHHGDLRNFVVLEFEGKTAKLVAYDGTGGPGTTAPEQELDTYTLTKP